MSSVELVNHRQQSLNPESVDLQHFAGDLFIPDQTIEDLGYQTEKFQQCARIGNTAVRFTVEIPEVITDPHPIVYAHGYCGFKIAYSELRHATARNGKIAATYHPPRVQKGLAGLHPDHALHPEKLLAQAVYGVMREMTQDHKKYSLESDQFDLSGHSMGGRSVTKVAEQHPDKVRTVILNEAAGLYDHDTVSLVKQVPAFTKEELAPALLHNQFSNRSTASVVLQAAHYIFRNPYKTLAEGLVVSNCDIRDNVRGLKEYGIKTAIIVGESDTLISAERTAQESSDVADLFAVYADPHANHIWPMVKPLETAQTHKQILQQLHG